jgi:hypothetical protein
MDFSHYPHRKQEHKTREMIMSALGQKSPLSCLWHFCYVCWFLFPRLGSAFVLCLCVCVISTAVWRFASDHPSYCSFAFSFEIMRLSLWLLGQVTSLLDFGEMPWKTQVHVLCFGLEMLIDSGSVSCKCVPYKTAFLKSFENCGPLHRRSAHTRTTFVKFPAPKTACKWTEETLYR